MSLTPVVATGNRKKFAGRGRLPGVLIVPDSARLTRLGAESPEDVALLIGGTGGIRTPGPVKVVRFQGGCIRPLCHRSAFDDTGLCSLLPGEVPERPNGMPC